MVADGDRVYLPADSFSVLQIDGSNGPVELWTSNSVRLDS